MTPAPLLPGLKTAAAERLGVVVDPEIADRVSPSVMLHTHALVLKPRTMKSPVDEVIQKRVDGIGEQAMAMRRRSEHRARMRRDGSARASAAPREADTSTGEAG